MIRIFGSGFSVPLASMVDAKDRASIEISANAY